MINYVKPKNIVPKPEEVRPHRSYAFTINPETQYFEESDCKQRVRRVIRNIQRILNDGSISYKLYIEVSAGGRLHGHGYIRIYNPLEFYCRFIPYIESKATIAIEIITDEDGWETYITKQCHIMRECPIQRNQPPRGEIAQSDIFEFYDGPTIRVNG